MAENDIEARPQQDAKPQRGNFAEEVAFGSAMDFVRHVEHLHALHSGNIPPEICNGLRAQWRRMGPLDTILVQKKLGSKLNAAINVSSEAKGGE